MANDRLRNRRFDPSQATFRAGLPPLSATEADRRDVASRGVLLRRIRREFEEMPGMSLTPEQARRLFALRQDVCERVLGELVQGGMLRCTPAGHFILNRHVA